MTSTTFLATARCPPTAAALAAAGARAAFLGAPIDTGVVPDRPGTALGPDACRRASQQFGGYPLYESGIDVAAHWRLVDCGDVAFEVADIGRHQAAIRAAMETLLGAGVLPVVFGGDHSVPIPGLAALCAKVHGPVGYLQLDAHLDTAHDVAGDTRTMASPVARAVEHASVDPANVAVVGVRGAANSREEIAAADALGIRVFSMDECLARGVDATIADALDAVWDGTRTVYVSFDNDAMDAAHAPGTTAPEPGGFTARELRSIAEAVGRRGVGALDVVELSPPHDPAGITARLDCYWILYLLGTYAHALGDGAAAPPPYADAREDE
jgi:agmatinase